MQNIETIAGTFTIGAYEIPKQYVCAKTPTITQKNDICEIVTYDQQITVNGHNYAPVLHQNCMQPEQITLYPLVKEGIINPDTIIIDAKSGTSGAGRGAKVANLFCEVNESMKAYGVGTHRHTPEIEEQLGYACGRDDLKLIFTPHLVPMNRGILVTAYANLKKDVTDDDVKDVYDKYYKDEYFVRVLDKGVCPETRWVEGSNFVDIGYKVEPRTHRLIMMGALDNLVKGAAGQAVQNMNLLFGLPENEGLQLAPMFP